MIQRLLPRIDEKYQGANVSLWLLGALLALKLLMSVNSLINARTIMIEADGIPLDSMEPGAAETAAMLFRSVNLGQLTLTLLGLAVLVRYRALVPALYALLLFDHLTRRLLSMTSSVPRTDVSSAGLIINLAILALLLIGFAFSLTRRSSHGPA